MPDWTNRARRSVNSDASRVAGPISEMGAHPVHLTLIRRLRVGHRSSYGSEACQFERKDNVSVYVLYWSTSSPTTGQEVAEICDRCKDL